jgi:hypothetical protein
LQLRPWKLIDDAELVLYRDPATGQMHYCSVMGALGEVFSVHVYIGDPGLRMFHQIAKEQLSDPFEFYANQSSVAVEWVVRGELEKPDKDLLAWLGHHYTPSVSCPKFRAVRRGFFPWYVSAEEARILTKCIQAVTTVVLELQKPLAPDFWSVEYFYPLVTNTSADVSHIDMVEVPPPADAPIQPAHADPERLARVRRMDLPIRGVTELDYFYTGGAVGMKDERKACASAALAVDADTAMLYSAKATVASTAPADGIMDALLDSIETTRSRPQEVRVRNPQLQQALEPLLNAMGLPIRATKRLPALDHARKALMEYLEDRH